jgi:hypothetical protein
MKRWSRPAAPRPAISFSDPGNEKMVTARRAGPAISFSDPENEKMVTARRAAAGDFVFRSRK